MQKTICYILAVALLGFIISPYIYLRSVKDIEFTHLKTKEYNQILEINGIIEGEETTAIQLSYPVYIKECFVKEDSYVNKGQLLFTLDLERMKEAVKSIDFTQYSQTNMSLDKADLVGISEEIYATESGIVKNIAANDGNLVLAEENLCVIENGNNMMLKISVEQEDYSKIKLEDRIVFSPTIATAREYSAVITDKTAVVRKESSLTGSKTVVDLFAEISEQDEYIVSGLEVSGTITNNRKKITTLPYEYIHQDDMGEYVNIYIGGRAVKRYVAIGLETETEAEVLTEFASDTVFVKGDIGKEKLFLNYDE